MVQGPIPQPIPNQASPLVGEDGRVATGWLQFFISLWMRTGQAIGTTPFVSGDMKAIGGPSIQDGWLLCDGSPVSRTQFVDLFSAIGTLWGAGDGLTTFNLPDLRGRNALGASATHTQGSTGGAETVTIAVADLPAHAHTISDPGHAHGVTDPGHLHTTAATANNAAVGVAAVGATAGNTGSSVTGLTVNAAATGITGTDNTGGGSAITTLSPFGAVKWCIKT